MTRRMGPGSFTDRVLNSCGQSRSQGVAPIMKGCPSTWAGSARYSRSVLCTYRMCGLSPEEPGVCTTEMSNASSRQVEWNALSSPNALLSCPSPVPQGRSRAGEGRGGGAAAASWSSTRRPNGLALVEGPLRRATTLCITSAPRQHV